MSLVYKHIPVQLVFFALRAGLATQLKGIRKILVFLKVFEVLDK